MTRPVYWTTIPVSIIAGRYQLVNAFQNTKNKLSNKFMEKETFFCHSWKYECSGHLQSDIQRASFMFTLHKTPLLNEPGHAKMYLMAYANNKDADQPAHPRSLISTFVVRCLDSMICILAISKVSRF